MKRPAIVIPCFDRPGSLQRLLKSIDKAQLGGDGPEVLLSIDAGGSRDVIDLALGHAASRPQWSVHEHREHLGLRRHLLWCGALTKQYGDIIILEDDLFVDPGFYVVAARALKEFEHEKKCAGVALYSPDYNEFERSSFSPVPDDTQWYRMRLPCSWGQAFSHAMWRRFEDWQAAGAHCPDTRLLHPELLKWPDSSWKKQFAMFMIATESDFLYPFVSRTTNFGDRGRNVARGTNRYQVELPVAGESISPSVGMLISAVAYDAFMEPVLPPEQLRHFGLPKDITDLSCDLYGSKPLELLRESPWVLTSRRPRNWIASYALRLRPPIQNLALEPGEEGEQRLFLCRGEAIRDARPGRSLLDFELSHRIRMSDLLRALPSMLRERLKTGSSG